MVVVMGKEHELCPHPDHLGLWWAQTLLEGSVGEWLQLEDLLSKTPLHGKLHVDTMAVMEYHCKKSAIIALSCVYKAMVAL